MYRSTEETMEKQKFLDPEIYVFNSAGCHGNYLTYLIDRLCTKTPKIDQLPFNSLGNSHKTINYSGYVKFIHTHQHEEQKNLKNVKIIKIIYSEDILYFERVAMKRAGDVGRDLDNLHKDISFMKDYNHEFYKKIKSLYSLGVDSVPKWLLRDAYKLGFLDNSRQGSVVSSQQEIQWMENNLSKNNQLAYVHVNRFFNYESLKDTLQELDDKFNLHLDLNDLEEIHQQFYRLNDVVQTHRNPEILLNAVDRKIDIAVPTLDIIQQAYVYAHLEQKYDFITMPMTENFFKNSKEIIDYCELYPQHYKAMNPNLPKFNGTDNPFFLHRHKKN